MPTPKSPPPTTSILPGASGTYSSRRCGPDFHKPNCGCRACVSRRRKAEALLDPTGSSTAIAVKKDDKRILDADAPTQIVETKRSARSYIGQWIEMRAAQPGISNEEVARRLQISGKYLNNLIVRASREGWLKFEDALERVEYELVPKAISNLSKLLDDNDRQATLETAKGTFFKTYADSKGAGERPQTVLALKIEMPEHSSGEMPIVTGVVVGKPRRIED